MARPELLNNVTHQNLRVLTRHAAEFGHQVGLTLTFPAEYADIQRHYPILFRKSPEQGQFQSVALLGFQAEENLFLATDLPGGWRTDYVPAMIARGPFMIGFQNQVIEGEEQQVPVIHLDCDDPRVNETQGQPLFLPHGGNSPYLEHIGQLLSRIRDGISQDQKMLAVFDRLGLLEPVNIEIELHNDTKVQLKGYYSISQDKLNAVQSDELVRLNRSGYLCAAYLALTSLGNISRMATLRNQQG